MKYQIVFKGTPKGGLNAAYKEHVSRQVEADSPEEAALKAYETHEHIPGGADSVIVHELKPEPNNA